MLAEIAKPPCPSPLPSALRDEMLGRVAGILGQPLPHLGDHLALGPLALLDRQFACTLK